MPYFTLIVARNDEDIGPSTSSMIATSSGAPLLIKHPPSHYLKKIYLESTSYHVPAARCPVETVGADHFIFGTDAPPMFPLKKESELIRRLNLPRDEEEKVYAGNARRLVKLDAHLPGGRAP